MKALVVSLSLLLSQPALAASTVVWLPRGANLADPERLAIGAVIADAYAVESQARIVHPEDAQKALEAAQGDAQAAAQALGVEETIECSAVKLSQAISLRCTRARVGGAPIHSAQMNAASLDDVRTVAGRMASALLRQVSTDATRSPSNIALSEGRAPNRVGQESVQGFATFATLPFNYRRDRYNPALGTGYSGHIEVNRFLVQTGAGLILSSGGARPHDLSALYLDFGGSYFLHPQNVGIYAGAGLQPRIVFTSLNPVTVVPHAKLGVMFPRESSTRVIAELRLAQNVLPMTTYDMGTAYPPYGGGRVEHYPTELTFSFGIGW